MKRQSFVAKLVGLLASRRFSQGLIALFVIEAAWIALSGRYPMAFDEDFHLGIIRLYAHHISPFWAQQPAGADAFGAVARDPSYLYQYLMSFPYRLVSVFTHSQTVLVLCLRAINIGLFAWGLGIYRRLLLKTGASRAVVHACLLAFVLLPVVPLLAAQINYDNLFIPLTGLVLLLAVRFGEELRQRKRLDLRLLLTLVIFCLLTSLVKYAFLPVFGAVVIYVGWMVWRAFPSWRKLWLDVTEGFRRLRRRSRWLLVAGLVLSSMLFVQRYGVNLARYHTPVPDCGKVLSVKQCSAYGPWIRDYNFKVNNVDEEHSPFVFTADWLYGMWLRLFFAVDGPGTDFETRGPLQVPGISSIIFAGAGLVVVLAYGRRVFRRYNRSVVALFTLTAVLYIATLWLDEYQAYVQTGQPVAINGRYLLPVLLLVFIVTALAAAEALRNRPRLKLAVAAVAILSLLWGGGALTYILRSRDIWYWPNGMARDANHAVQHVLWPLVPGTRQPTEFMR